MSKPQILLKELASGSAYNKLPIWFNNCFYVIFTDQGLTIWNWFTFRKIIIPKQAIKKLISERVTFWGMSQSLLRIIHSHINAPKIIRFRSVNYKSWFEVFEKSGIPTEDETQIKNAVSCLSRSTKLNFIIGIIVFIFLIVTLFILP